MNTHKASKFCCCSFEGFERKDERTNGMDGNGQHEQVRPRLRQPEQGRKSLIVRSNGHPKKAN